MLCILKTCYESRMYQLRIECGTDYPDKPPNVWFLTRVNMKSVDSGGRVCVPVVYFLSVRVNSLLPGEPGLAGGY